MLKLGNIWIVQNVSLTGKLNRTVERIQSVSHLNTYPKSNSAKQ